MKLTEDQITLIIDAVTARAATYPAEDYNSWYDQPATYYTHVPKRWRLEHG